MHLYAHLIVLHHIHLGDATVSSFQCEVKCAGLNNVLEQGNEGL